MTCLNSPKMRSAATRSSPGASRPIAAAVSGSIVRSRSIAIRTARSVRSGSSASAPGATMRSRRASRSARPPCGSSSSPPASGSAIALTVKSRAARSAWMSQSRRITRSTCQEWPGPDDAPRAERAGEPERRAAGRARERARGVRGIFRDREVEVRRGAAEQPVAYGAADDPRLAPGEDLAGRRERVGLGHGATSRAAASAVASVTARPRAEPRASSSARTPSRWCSRGTRALIPQVIS